MSTDRLVQREENRIHLLNGERLQKKERKESSQRKCRRMDALLGIGKEFSKMQNVNTCLIERLERNSEIVSRIKIFKHEKREWS